MGIHNEIMKVVAASLQATMITNIPMGDVTRAGVVQLGPLQGDPDPDEARISVTIHENDPDLGGEFKLTTEWSDDVADIECGGAVTFSRCFTARCRCLLVNTGESLAGAREIASTVRDRIEKTLLDTDFSDVSFGSESVSRGVLSAFIKSEMLQSGGPESYDFHIKVRFDVLTTLITA